MTTVADQFANTSAATDAAGIGRRGLLMPCRHRGTQEIDLIVRSFIKASSTGSEPAQLDRFEASRQRSHTDLFD